LPELQALSCPGDALALEVTQDLPSGIVARRTGDAASRMASRTAQIETRDRTSIIRVTQHRTRREDLPQIERSVENIAADKSECSLKVERGKDLARQHRAPEIRCMIIDRFDREIGDGFTVVIS
jgi:hypothetical protein